MAFMIIVEIRIFPFFLEIKSYHIKNLGAEICRVETSFEPTKFQCFISPESDFQRWISDIGIDGPTFVPKSG